MKKGKYSPVNKKKKTHTGIFDQIRLRQEGILANPFSRRKVSLGGGQVRREPAPKLAKGRKMKKKSKPRQHLRKCGKAQGGGKGDILERENDADITSARKNMKSGGREPQGGPAAGCKREKKVGGWVLFQASPLNGGK